jgi:very-short-patch-repair endonuclease
VAGYTKQTLLNAKRLRRALTEAEKLLWSALRSGQIEGAKFRRQQPIGPYIGDFVCQANRLIVEADGSQHLESEHDLARDACLKSVGYTVLRFWNSDIHGNLEGVLEAIRLALIPPHPPIAAQWAPPSPSRGEVCNGANID